MLFLQLQMLVTGQAHTTMFSNSNFSANFLIRAYINTYISLLASTVCTFIASSIFGEGRKFQAVDVQNATLAGGVIVGATADLMLQPYGAFLAGSVAGLVSTFGYQVIQPALQN